MDVDVEQGDLVLSCTPLAGRDQLPTAVGEADRQDFDVLADDGPRARKTSDIIVDAQWCKPTERQVRDRSDFALAAPCPPPRSTIAMSNSSSRTARIRFSTSRERYARPGWWVSCACPYSPYIGSCPFG